MSEMEFFYGTFTKFEGELLEDEDAYEAGERLNLTLVAVGGDYYSIESLLTVDSYGFAAVVPPSEKPQLLLYWYNGGAGLEEVAEEAIKKWLDKKK
ncbi:MAG: hypothetical protein CMB99_00460 [Flavobacteriaceae bacterium]|mgnify:FL=1|nr:hypothetical protein [Flavobacteriaceae bacterium]|tara:strand:+ start:57770 stop:58057 length:288 start_codon:yes stop_codon:yes gene_type:complete